MKQLKRSGIYKAANLSFNPHTEDAFSYDWYRLVGRVDGVLVFNDFRYSVTTAKHQRKLRALFAEIGVKPDLVLTLPRGVRHDQTLAELIVECEEHLCDVYLESEIKRQERNARATFKRRATKLTDLLENQKHFRDYEIEPREKFGTLNNIAVHQIVDSESMDSDVENALHSFHRDGFGCVVFYV